MKLHDKNLNSDIANYPRPQFRRADWSSLDGAWRFAFDNDGRQQKPAEVLNWPLTIEVPFAPESERSGIADQGFHKACWYQREFDVAPNKNEHVILHFGAVDYEASVWVNEHYVGCHAGGHTPFHFDITTALNASGPQTVTVRATDDPFDLAKPRGKQDWEREPHSIWYPRTTGIWQSVWIEAVPETRLDAVLWTAHLEAYEIGCEIKVAGIARTDLRLRVRLEANNELLADDTYTIVAGEVHRRIALSDPGIDDYRNKLLWSPERPTLILAELELVDGNNVVIDRVASYTALRSVGFQRDRFMLNGRPYYLRLVLDQGYWPESLMTAPNVDAFAKDIRLTKAMGFNGVRKHQKIEDPRFLYQADTLGLLVWEEMPSAYRFTRESVERIGREWIEVINRDINHPCIVAWVPFNESWGVPDLPEKKTHQHCVQALFHLTKTLDASRPVLGNDGWEALATDMIGIHDYDGSPERISRRYCASVNVDELFGRQRPGGRLLTIDGHPHRGLPILLTEFGGIAVATRERDSVSWGYSVSTDNAELEIKYRELLKVVNSIELFAGFCYTQLTDTFQEANGLLTANREPKFSLERLSSATRGQGPLHVPHHDAPTCGEVNDLPAVPQHPQMPLEV